LTTEEIAGLQNESNRPIALLQRIGDELRIEYKAGNIHPQHLPLLEGALTDFTNLQGGCERIKSTPIPFSYNILLHRIVAIYCFVLPYGLVPLLGGVTPIVVALIGYAFLGIDALGDEIEEPFGMDDNDLPLLAISTMIEHNIRQRIGDEELPPLKHPNPITRVLN
jgi:putative membrane protein